MKPVATWDFLKFKVLFNQFVSRCVGYTFSVNRLPTSMYAQRWLITTHMKSLNNVSVDYYKANANTSQAYICIVKQRNYMLNLWTPPLFELQKD
jgi:hypothetical protein